MIMAKFVIAGKADCPYYAKAELLADYLQKNLPDFQIFKITQHPDVWEEWLKEVCEKNKWSHKKSPIVWRELLDRGGKALLLGGYNDFLEHAQHDYRDDDDNCSREPGGTQRKSIEEGIPERPGQPLTGLDHQEAEGQLLGLVLEAQDLAAPLLRGVALCTRAEDAFRGARAVVMLDEPAACEVSGVEECLRHAAARCRDYAGLLERNAHGEVRVLVAGKSFVNLRAALLQRFAPSLARNVVAVALGVEGQAKAVLARKLRAAPACIKNVIIWGNITGNNYADLRQARAYEQESAVWGPPPFSRPVLEVIFDREWVKNEFMTTLKTLTATGRHFGGILAAHSIGTTLKYWYQGSFPGEIVSLGVLSEGQFGIPEGIVFSMPVKFENGTWAVLTDLKNTEINREIMTKMTSDLIQEIRVALGEPMIFQPHQSDTEVPRRDENIVSVTEHNQEELRLSHGEDVISIVVIITLTLYSETSCLKFLEVFEGNERYLLSIFCALVSVRDLGGHSKGVMATQLSMRKQPGD
ncbi:putative malate dehydrogenase 1B isoform X2 [Cavia porcellus]|uniref:putative malate dehydrogenase 1B isoform X2 n=1 Tax=Cavia porcellus TaxID=10141 RepID=UPI002FE0F1C8